MKRFFFFFFIFFVSFVNLVEAQQVNDPQLQSWATLYVEGKLDVLNQELINEVRSDGTNTFFAGYLWCMLFDDASVSVSIPALERSCTIRRFRNNRDISGMMDAFPPNEVSHWENYWDIRSYYFGLNNGVKIAEYRQLLLDLLVSGSDDFNIVWTLVDAMRTSEKLRLQVREIVADSTCCNPQARAFLDNVSRYTDAGNLHTLESFLEVYGEEVENDEQVRFLAFYQSLSRNYSESAAHWLRFTKVYPYGNGFQSAALNLYRLGEKSEALRLIQQRAYAVAKLNNEDVDATRARYTSELYRSLGEWGKAREALMPFLNNDKATSAIYLELARVEFESKRFPQAAEAASNAFKLSEAPASLSLWMESLLESGNSSEVWDVFGLYRDSHHLLNERIYWIAGSALSRMDADDVALELYREALGHFPYSGWMLRMLGNTQRQMRNYRDAITHLTLSVESDSPNLWAFLRLAEAYSSMYGERASSQYKNDIVERFPEHEHAWRGLAHISPLNALNIYEEARERNPNAYWPISRMVSVMTDSSIPFEHIYSLLDVGFESLDSWNTDARINFYLNYMDTIDREGRRTTLTSEKLDILYTLANLYLEDGGSPAHYHHTLFKLNEAARNHREAIDHLLQALDHNPDNLTYIATMFTDFILQSNRNDAFIRFHRYVERNPWDGARIAALAHRHLRWGGSALVALQLYERLAEIAPNHLNRSEYNSALQTLGNRTASYRHTYFNRPCCISPSDRYITWYDATRNDAQRESLDYALNEDGSIDIFHPNGMVATYKDDRVTGRPVLIRFGATYVKAAYDERGNLLEIEASSGSSVRFEYNERNQIIAFLLKERGLTEESWFIEYDDNHQIVKVSDREHHTLIIERDDEGEIVRNIPSDGWQTTQKISEVFNKMTRLARLMDNQRYGEVPDLPFEDAQRELLSNRWYNTYGDEEAPAGLAYARYLLDNLRDHQNNMRDLESVLKYMSEPGNVSMNDEQRLQLISLWYEYLSETRPLGVNQSDWNYWQSHLNWMEQQQFRRALVRQADALKTRIEQNPISLLPAARWIPESEYMNPALWTFSNIADLGRQHGINLKVHSIIRRVNGHLLAGTSHGLAINRNGYWELLPFDDVRGHFNSNATPLRQANASSNITSIVETDEGSVWVGTQAGLMLLGNDYTDRPRRWRTASEGLPHPGIVSLNYHLGNLYVSTTSGLLWVDQENLTLQTIASISVKEFSSFSNYEYSGVVTATDGIWLVVGDNVRKIHESRTVKSAIIGPSGDEVFFIERNILYRKPLEGHLDEKYPVTGQQDIVKTTNLLSLRYLPIPEELDVFSIAVLTDQGITAYHQSNFEFLSLPEHLTDRRIQVDDIRGDYWEVFFIVDQGVLRHAKNEQEIIRDIYVRDIIYAPAWNYTFFAAANRLLYTSESNKRPQIFDFVRAQQLDLTPDGGLLTTDGTQIIYYAPGTLIRQGLFTSEGLLFLENAPNVRTPEVFNSVLAASDGTVWATTPSTVFRFVPTRPLNEGPDEDHPAELFVYSMFKDSEEFPANSDMISRVIETKDGDIWVVASDEGHRYIGGVQLSGGLLRFNGTSFDMITRDAGLDWFITSYTDIGDNTALVGTTRGFVLHQGSRYRQLSSLEDPSYMKLRSENPMLWLGTQGSKFGEDTWLFGTPGGVVLYNNGAWFYPQQLNRLLPDDMRFGERGARHIHAVGANQSGQIYVSTDRGLLVYDVGDNDDALLFQQNGMFEQAISHHQRRQLIQESDVLMSALSQNADLRRLMDEINAERIGLEKLQEELHGNERLGRRSAPPSSEISASGDRPPQLQQELEQRRRNYDALTRLLEMEHHGAFQLLQLNPLDVAQLRHQLGESDRVAVYIPSRDKLTIQLIDRNQIQLIEVHVQADRLNYLSTFVADHLAGRRFENRRTFGASAIVQPQDNSERDQKVATYLEELYEHLLRPIESMVFGDDILYVVPTGSLNYLPYSALIRSTQPRVEYAVQRFNMGVLPSMYLLDLVLRHQPSTSRNAMIIGDPDGTLPGARVEAQEIHNLLRPTSPLLLGNAADKNAILRHAEDARVVHFATHGKLNPEDPARSFLVLAGNQQLGVVDVMQLPLRNTDLVVLSACETGLGTTGLEYATLARAFAHAGAPSILATLWEVPDEPSTLLVTQFYRNLQAGSNVFKALSQAQRFMLNEYPNLQHPVNWAGYVPFGKP